MSNLTLSELRTQLNDIQVKCINEIWNYYKEKKDWIRTRTLHQRIESKTIVLKALNELGGSIVYETRDQYALTFLGIMLTDDCFGKEELLIKYIKYTAKRFISDPEIDKINSYEVKEDLYLTEEQTNILKELLSFGHYYGSSFLKNNNNNTLSAGIPTNIDDLTEINDLKTYILNQIIDSFNQNVPISELERYYFYSSQNSISNNEFSFIRMNFINEIP